MIGYQQLVTQGYTDVAPPFLQTCPEVGDSPRRQINLPKEACHFFFTFSGVFFLFFSFFKLCACKKYLHYVQIYSI